jgi:hypothetical protein
MKRRWLLVAAVLAGCAFSRGRVKREGAYRVWAWVDSTPGSREAFDHLAQEIRPTWQGWPSLPFELVEDKEAGAKLAAARIDLSSCDDDCRVSAMRSVDADLLLRITSRPTTVYDVDEKVEKPSEDVSATFYRIDRKAAVATQENGFPSNVGYQAFDELKRLATELAVEDGRAPREDAVKPVYEPLPVAVETPTSTPPVEVRTPPPPAPTPTPSRPPIEVAGKMVAVLEVRSSLAGKDKEELQRGYFSDQVRRLALKSLPALRVVSRENIAVLAQAQGLDLEQCEGLCAVETGRKLSADLVVSGTLLKMGSFYKLTLELHDTHSGEMLASGQASGKSPDALLGETDAAITELLARLR